MAQPTAAPMITRMMKLTIMSVPLSRAQVTNH